MNTTKVEELRAALERAKADEVTALAERKRANSAISRARKRQASLIAEIDAVESAESQEAIRATLGDDSPI